MLAVVVIWAGNLSIVKAALSGLAPLPFTAVRFTAASLLLAVLLRLREGVLRVPRVHWWKLFWLGIVGNTIRTYAAKLNGSSSGDCLGTSWRNNWRRKR